jgi:hypothetical protein
MSFLSQRLYLALKQKILFVMPEILKLDALRNSLAITFAVTMATFFVCDVNVLKHLKKNRSSIITSANPFSFSLILFSK